MKKKVNYILAGLLTLLGFSSCSALHEARAARAERERLEQEAQQRALVEQELARMEEEDARRETAKKELERIEGERNRAVLLYAVPNVPYRRIEESK